MAPREANNPYQYLIEFDATAMIMPHDAGPAGVDETLFIGEGNVDLDGLPIVPPPGIDDGNAGNQTNIADETSLRGMIGRTYHRCVREWRTLFHRFIQHKL